ncbi:MAG: hypothetical protein KR126chlam4_01180 [Candidatus Anoxychlamydiales bacterium]|nr:hypothetical protein [Candidatus Anoxychlamydiales bacterium]NGX41341.1 hypothetical protein [Candidatus Anoxychlamydiales bacterium]HEU64104.1 hypothetical protein [Chlamydiota bacterium]
MKLPFKFKKIGIIILNISLIVFSSYFILHSERLQEKISPQKFWQKKINTLSTELKNDDIKIKSLKLDLEKELALSTYTEKQAEIKAEEINENPHDIYFEMQDEQLKKVSEIKNQINLLTKDEKKIKTDLENAYSRVNSLK